MSYVHGSSTRVLVNEKEISTEISGWSLGHNRQMSEVTTGGQPVGAAGASFTPGLMSGTLGLRGPQQADPTTGLTAEIQQAIGVDNAFMATCLPDGVAIGKPAMFVVGDPTEYTVDATVSDAVSMTFSATADESVEMGWVLSALQAYTADALAGTAVDRGTSLSVVAGSPVAYSTNGLVAGMHVTAYAGFTGVAVKIQHSPDNSAWSDLVSFVNVTAVGAQRVSVARGVTINRYLRASIDVTGSGSVTLLVTAAPR
jgi:hypothetical protein